MGFLDALFNPSKNTNRAYSAANADFARTRGVTDPFYQQLVSSGGQANRLYGDFVGLNGASAQQSALSNWQKSPGYQYAVDQGIDAIDASAAARGMLRSGATLQALNQHGQNLYNQEYGSYLDRLAGLTGGGYQGAQGLGGNSQTFAELAVGAGGAKDAGNAAKFGNLMSIAGTIFGGFTGMPSKGTASKALSGGGIAANPVGRLY